MVREKILSEISKDGPRPTTQSCPHYSTNCNMLDFINHKVKFQPKLEAKNKNGIQGRNCKQNHMAEKNFQYIS